jgi:hypothetical protein
MKFDLNVILMLVFVEKMFARWLLAELISSTLKMEEICSSETSVETQRTTRRYISEDGTLHNHRSENLKSYVLNPIVILATSSISTN